MRFLCEGRVAHEAPGLFLMLPAQEIGDFVVKQIRRLACDPDLAEQVFAEAVKQQRAKRPQLEAEAKRLHRERQHKVEQIKRLVAVIGTAKEPLASITGSLAELESAVRCIDQRLVAIREEIVSFDARVIDSEDVTAALAQFDALWEVLHPQERVRIINLLVERVVYDAQSGEIHVDFHPTCINALAHNT